MCLYTNIQKHEVNDIFIYENKKWILCCMNTIHEIHKIYQYYKKNQIHALPVNFLFINKF